MKFGFLVLFSLFFSRAKTQNVQLLYDVRHTLDPQRQPKNFPSLYFEYYKEQDSGKSVIKPGAFLFKMQSDLLGTGENIGKTYLQLTQTLRFWQPKVFLHLSYSGGLGVTEPKAYSYYIFNTYAAGVSWPFQLRGGYFTLVLDCQYVSFQRPSVDPLLTIYFYKAFLNYRLEIEGDVNVWSANKNHGDQLTSRLNSKRIFFYGEPQVWYGLKGKLSAGVRINIFYHVNTTDNLLECFPAFGFKWKI